MLQFFGQLLGIALRAAIPLPLDLMPSFWRSLIGQPLAAWGPEAAAMDPVTANYLASLEVYEEYSIKKVTIFSSFQSYSFMQSVDPDSLNTDPDTDPDPDPILIQGFDDPKLKKKNTAENPPYLFW